MGGLMRQFAAGLWLLLMVGNPISAYAFKGDYHEGITGIALSYYNHLRLTRTELASVY